MIEMDGNDPVVANTGSSSKVENDLVISRKRKLSESELDQVEIENEENELVVGVTDTGNVAEQKQSNGPTDEEVPAYRCISTNLFRGCIVMPVSLPIFFSLLVDALCLQ
jgi:hypothetical protein